MEIQIQKFKTYIAYVLMLKMHVLQLHNVITD